MSSVSKTIAKNSTSIVIANFIMRFASFVFNVFVVRHLGGASFGKYSTVMAYVGIFAIFSDMGMATYAMREMAQDKSKTAFLTWNSIVFRMVLSFVVIPTITSMGIVLGYPPETVLGIAIASSGLLLHAIYGPINNIMLGYERMDLRSVLQVVERITFVLIGTIVLLQGANFIWLIVGTQASVFVAMMVGIILLIKFIGWFPFEQSPRQWGRLLLAGLPFGAITLTMEMANRIDTVILSLWVVDVQVGWYALAYNLMINLLFFSDALTGALGPTLARTYAANQQTANMVYQTAFRILFMVSIPVAVAMTILADKLILFLYTDEFLPAIPALQILVWAIPFISLHNLCSAMVTASYREKKQARVRVMGALVNIGLNLLVIPRYGFIGAAVVTVLTELTIFTFMFSLVNDQFVLQSVIQIIAKPLLAAFLMGAVVLLGRNFNLFLIGGLGIVVYVLTLIIIKAVNFQDPNSVESSLLRDIGRRLRK